MESREAYLTWLAAPLVRKSWPGYSGRKGTEAKMTKRFSEPCYTSGTRESQGIMLTHPTTGLQPRCGALFISGRACETLVCAVAHSLPTPSVFILPCSRVSPSLL